MPIGNLTSQFFANVYLDALDQFVKHGLKARWYLRYCDDLVLMSEDADQLRDWEARIAAFLQDRLALRLNDRRKLRPLTDGIDFLGDLVRTDYRLVRRRVVGTLEHRLAEAERRLRLAGLGERDGRLVLPWPAVLLEQVRQWLNAYLAHFAKAETWRLVEGIRARHAWLEAYFDWSSNGVAPRHGLRAVYPSAHPFLHGALAAATLAIGVAPAMAAVIDDSDKYAWSENAGWLNFKSANNTTPVQVYPTISRASSGTRTWAGFVSAPTPAAHTATPTLPRTTMASTAMARPAHCPASPGARTRAGSTSAPAMATPLST